MSVKDSLREMADLPPTRRGGLARWSFLPRLPWAVRRVLAPAFYPLCFAVVYTVVHRYRRVFRGGLQGGRTDLRGVQGGGPVLPPCTRSTCGGGYTRGGPVRILRCFAVIVRVFRYGD